MKKLIYLLCILFPAMLEAQTDVKGVYLLDDFTISVATVKKGNPIKASFNYDCVKQEMQFEEENGTILKLEDINNIDTLFLGSHKMIPYSGRFLEVARTTPDYTLLVDHKRRLINKGRKGAMGTTTQGTVENVDFSKSAQGYSTLKMTDISVYSCKDEPSYVLVLGGKTKKFRDSKSFLKLVSADKKEEIEAYIKDKKISFKDIESVISLVDYSVQ